MRSMPAKQQPNPQGWFILVAALFFTYSSQAAGHLPSLGMANTLSTTKNTARSISYSELLSLTGAFDADGDEIQFVIAAVPNGSAAVNGSAVALGATRIGKTDVLTWTPPVDAYNVFVDALQVKAFDGSGYSETATQIGASINGNNPPELTFIEPLNRENLHNAHRNEPYTLSFDVLKHGSDLRDMDDDAVSFAIDSVATGALFLDGQAVAGRAIVGTTNILTWVPPTNTIGVVTAFKMRGFDGTDVSVTPIAVSVEITDPTPNFTKGINPKVLRDDFGQWISNWATAIRPDEYALHFETTTDNPDLFSSEPEVTDDGTLMFVAAPSAFGVANVTVVLADDQGHRSLPQSFTITVSFVNYAPQFDMAEELTVNEDGGSQKITEFARDISAGDGEAFQVLSFVVTVTNSALYSVKPTLSTNGTLTFKTATNAFGDDLVTVTLKDNGNTLNNGVNATAKTFRLHVVPVNDPPTVALKTITLNEDNEASADLGLKDSDSASENLSATVTSFGDTVLSAAEVSRVGSAWMLHVTPKANAFGKTTIELSVSDGQNSVVSSVAVNVAPVNDAPQFALATDIVTPPAFGQLTTISNFASQVSAGPNETNQAVTFDVSSATPTFFATKPTLMASGVLKFKVADGVTGSNLVTVVAKDNGGIANGGISQSAPQYFWIVSPKNPFPELKGVYGGLFFEESGVKHSSSGYLSATVTDKGAYSGKVQIEGGSYSLSGQFSTTAESAVTLPRKGKTALKLNLTLSSEGLVGTVADGNWSAGLFADKAVYSLTNVAPQTGKYTVALGTDQAHASGVATVTVSAAGIVNGSANLSDGTLPTLVSFVTKRGQCPVYISLYGGAGSMLGWVNFANTGASDLAGNLSWIKTSTNALVAGFTNSLVASGSAYRVPALGERILAANLSATFADDSLAQPLLVPITLSTNNVFTCSGYKLTLKANLQTGLVTGTFIHPVTKTSIAIKAVVDQKVGTIDGFFVTPQGVGSFSGN